MLPAVGQGALCIEIRQQDPRIAPLAAAMDDPVTRQAVMGERAFLHRLQGGCQVPIAGHGVVAADRFTLSGLVCDVDGSHRIQRTLAGAADQSERIGRELADALLSQGAGEMLERLNAHAQ